MSPSAHGKELRLELAVPLQAMELRGFPVTNSGTGAQLLNSTILVPFGCFFSMFLRVSQCFSTQTDWIRGSVSTFQGHGLD